jgi:ribosomal protein L12E/L44/L45/RPP1/RPP2
VKVAVRKLVCVKAIPSWVTYTVLRLLLFAVPLVILLLLQLPWWLAAIVAAIVGLCLSYLLLGSSRHAVARDIDAVRSRKKAPTTSDDELEDAVIDAVENDAVAIPEAPAAASEEQAQPEEPAASKDEGGPEEQAKDKSGDPGQFQR